MNQIALVIIHITLSIIVAAIGENRKFGFWGYLFASIFMTPLVGFILVLASDAPPKTKVKKES